MRSYSTECILQTGTVRYGTVRYEPRSDVVGMTTVCQSGYTVSIKPDSNRDPGQEVLVPDMVMLRSSLVILPAQHNVLLWAIEFNVE
jgi:hypothetical protein